MSQFFMELDSKDVLISVADKMRKDGYRLAQASVTQLERYDILYTFAKADELQTLRLAADEGEEIQSISGIFPYAYLYENEMKDLFGVNIVNINLDFHGHLYKTAVKTPFKKEKTDG